MIRHLQSYPEDFYIYIYIYIYIHHSYKKLFNTHATSTVYTSVSDEQLIIIHLFRCHDREGVAMIKHLQSYPEDGVAGALRNVVGFDAYDPHLRSTLARVFQQRGYVSFSNSISITHTYI
jgi:hypothetical protein